MGMVVKRLRIRGDKGSATVTALFDTGASKSLIRRDVARRVASLAKVSPPWTFALGDGRGRLRSNEMGVVLFVLNGVSVSHAFVVAPTLADEVIVGVDLMQLWRIRPDPVLEKVILDKRRLKLKLV